MENTPHTGLQPTQYGHPGATTSAVTLDTYGDFTKYIAGRKCSACNTAYIQSSKDIEAIFQGWFSGKGSVSSHVKCKKCSKETCITCFRQSIPTRNDANGTKVNLCCGRGRLFMVWIILCGFDQVYCGRQRKDAAITGSNHNIAAGKGTGFERDRDLNSEGPRRMRGLPHNFTNTPYSLPWQPTKASDAAKAKAENVEQKQDSFETTIFSLLQALVPDPYATKPTSWDVNPPIALVSLLMNSKIFERAAELLRNDSLDDASKRLKLYTAFFNFLQFVGAHPKSKQQVMFSDRVALPDNINLLTLSFQGLPSNVVSHSRSSLATGLRNLNIQSNIMMKGAQRDREDFQDQAGNDLLWLCRKISDLSDHLHVRAEADATWTHGIVEVPDDQIFQSHMSGSGTWAGNLGHAGRMKRLMTELATLKTGLSPGIYVKHAMSRPDLMKILIIGPEDTPYENGFFEFDLECRIDFPYRPPVVKYRGFCGSADVHPNIHGDGKVCLSLLGIIDEGEQWQPGQSTILQVLISIQSMIFCANPVSSNLGVFPQEELYNNGYRGYTAKYGILDWARNPPALWKDIVEHRLKVNGNRILQTVEDWARNNRTTLDIFSKRTVDIATILPELQQVLKGYGATYVPARIESTPSSRTSRGEGEFGSAFPDGNGGGFGGSGGGYGGLGEMRGYGRGFPGSGSGFGGGGFY